MSLVVSAGIPKLANIARDRSFRTNVSPHGWDTSAPWLREVGARLSHKGLGLPNGPTTSERAPQSRGIRIRSTVRLGTDPHHSASPAVAADSSRRQK